MIKFSKQLNAFTYFNGTNGIEIGKKHTHILIQTQAMLREEEAYLVMKNCIQWKKRAYLVRRKRIQ